MGVLAKGLIRLSGGSWIGSNPHTGETDKCGSSRSCDNSDGCALLRRGSTGEVSNHLNERQFGRAAAAGWGLRVRVAVGRAVRPTVQPRASAQRNWIRHACCPHGGYDTRSSPRGARPMREHASVTERWSQTHPRWKRPANRHPQPENHAKQNDSHPESHATTILIFAGTGTRSRCFAIRQKTISRLATVALARSTHYPLVRNE